jgi:hypothetical protein
MSSARMFVVCRCLSCLCASIVFNAVDEQTMNTSKSSAIVNQVLSPVQAFIERQQAELAAKDANEQRNKDELRQQAKNDLERWYRERNMSMECKRRTMKADEDILRSNALETSDKTSCDWAKVIRFLDFNSGTQLSKTKRDLTRMKACMIHAKRDRDGRS